MLFLAILILITSLAIAGIAAYFSIVGLALLFVGSGQSIVIMGTALEVGKLVVVSFLHQYWERLNFLIKTDRVKAISKIAYIGKKINLSNMLVL